MLALALFWFCYVEQFRSFAEYDDEGYVMLTLRQFMHGMPLYDQLFTQYGPFHFVFKALLHLITFSSVNHDNTRLMSLGLWTIAAFTCAYYLNATTGRRTLAAILYIQTIFYFTALINEPGHPHETVLLLIFLALSTLALSPSQLSFRYASLILGMIAAALLLTKLNVGVLFCASLMATVLCVSPPRAFERARTGVLVLFAAIPFAIMYRHAFTPELLHYFALTTISIALAMAANLRFGVELRFENNWLTWFAIGLAVVVAFSLIPVFVMGTTMSGLITGIIVNPAKLSGLYFTPVQIALPGLSTVLIMSAAGITYMFSNSILGLSPTQSDRIVAALKIGFALWAVYLSPQGALAVLTFLPASLWLLPAGLDGISSRGKILRIGLMNLAAFQLLQAYPVAGSQVTWASFLLLLSAYVLLSDGLNYFFSQGVHQPGPFVRLFAGAAACLAAFVFFWDHSMAGLHTAQFRSTSHVMLDGARRLRLPPAQKVRYEYLTANVRPQCTALATMPGYGSYNVWSGVSPPTGRNVTFWTILFDDRTQQEVVAKLDQSSRPCAVVCESCLGGDARFATEPLVRYIRTQLVSDTSIEGVELRVRESNRPAAGSSYLISGTQSFNGTDDVYDVPSEALYQHTPVTIRLWFRTAYAGGLLGVQSNEYPAKPSEWAPVLYVGVDGHLHGGFFTGNVGQQMISTGSALTDDRWHQAVLVKERDKQTLYLDGTPVGVLSPAKEQNMRVFQLGSAYTLVWPAGTRDWMMFRGAIYNAEAIGRAWEAADVNHDWAQAKPR